MQRAIYQFPVSMFYPWKVIMYIFITFYKNRKLIFYKNI